MALLAAFASGLTLAMGIGTGDRGCVWFSLVFIILAGLFSWGDKEEEG